MNVPNPTSITVVVDCIADVVKNKNESGIKGLSEKPGLNLNRTTFVHYSLLRGGSVPTNA